MDNSSNMVGGRHLRPVASTDNWATAEDVAKAVALSPDTIYRLARLADGFPVIHVGPRCKRFVVAEVKRYLLEHPERVAAASAAHSRYVRECMARREAEGRPPRTRRRQEG